jgi:hypothetical protein
MSIIWSDEQEKIFSTVEQSLLSGKSEVITVQAVAGSAKSSSMVEATRRVYSTIKPKVNYLVFGNALSKEATNSFGELAEVSTLHKLAHDYVIKRTNMYLTNTSFISFRDVPKYIHQPYNALPTAMKVVEGFANSNETSMSEYLDTLDEVVPNRTIKLASDILYEMTQGNMPCTHAVYLKVFHAQVMNGTIKLPEYDMLIVDEAQDLTPITVDIVRAHPARIKVLVGDTNQSIFGFLGCVNAFNFYPNSTKLSLSKSFRVCSNIAHQVESFCREYFNPTLVFKGMDYSEMNIETVGYLTRTNSALISKMIRLEKAGTPFKLATNTKVSQMFELPLAILSAISGKMFSGSKHNYLLKSVAKFNMKTKDGSSSSVLSFIREDNPDNPDLKGAIQTILEHSPDGIMKAYTSAKSHMKSDAKLTLTTIHTSKGATYDHVIFDNDVDKAIDDIISKANLSISETGTFTPNSDELPELYLYYVAATRARYRLDNATYLI